MIVDTSAILALAFDEDMVAQPEPIMNEMLGSRELGLKHSDCDG